MVVIDRFQVGHFRYVVMEKNGAGTEKVFGGQREPSAN